MKHMLTKLTIASTVALAVTQTLTAGTAPYFIPLTADEILEPADSVDERNKPWTAPAGITQRNLTSMLEIETSENGQTAVRNPQRSQVASMWDMLAYDNTGNYIFIPHETVFGAGVSRYDVVNDRTDLLFAGDGTLQSGFINDTDFGAFDPVRYTPNNTIVAGEEWSGTGRLVEFCDPLGAVPADPIVGGGDDDPSNDLVEGDCLNDPNAQYRVLSGLPLSAQEGISFSIAEPNRVWYYIDEDNTGSIYRMEFLTPGDYSSAQTFVLSVNAFNEDPSLNWDDTVSPRVGPATWVPITDENGQPFPGRQDPTENILIEVDGELEVDDAGLAGRIAGDEAGGTPYGRPEDTTITMSGSGNELIYFTATSEDAVYSIEETENGPYVRLAAQQLGKFGEGTGTEQNVGFAPTNALFNNPDNLAIDSLGNIYVIEDAPNGTTVGTDGGVVWFMRDMDNDGVAESLDHFLSLQVNQSEHTGMIFNPVDPTKFVIAVQHPASTALADLDQDGVRDLVDGLPTEVGFGDAMWEFDITNVAPPECVGPRSNFFTFNTATNRFVRACSNQRDYNVIEQAIASEPADDLPTP